MNLQRLSNRYLLTELLGEGGMGTVWRAWDEQDQAWRAVKLLQAGLLDSEVVIERFRREIEVLRLVVHQRIVRLYDHGVERGLGFLVMEFMDGGSLEAWMLRHGRLHARQAASITSDLCAALGASHAQGVIHRDIKPANILIAPDNTIRLADFGLARFMGSDRNLTRTNIRMGSVGFMSPEQARNARDVDHRADLFAAGATLYCLLTARAPVDIETALARDYETLSPGLAHVIMRSTLPNREHRYNSAAEMEQAIARAITSLPPLPPTEPALYEPVYKPLPTPESNPTIIV